jgi:hypothetical protein
MSAARRIFSKLRQLAPYTLIELLLPGGTLLAVGLWLYRRRARSRSTASAACAITRPAIEPTC